MTFFKKLTAAINIGVLGFCLGASCLHAKDATTMLEEAQANYNEKHLMAAATGYEGAAFQMRKQLGEKLAAELPKDAFDSKPGIGMEDGAAWAEMNFVIEKRNVAAGIEGKYHWVQLYAGRGDLPEKLIELQQKRTKPQYYPLKKGERILDIKGCQAFLSEGALARNLVVFIDEKMKFTVTRGTDDELIQFAQQMDFDRLRSAFLPKVTIDRGAVVMDLTAIKAKYLASGSPFDMGSELQTQLDNREPEGDVALKTTASKQALDAGNIILAAEIADEAAFQTRRTWPGILAKYLPPAPADWEQGNPEAPGFTEKIKWKQGDKDENAIGGPLLLTCEYVKDETHASADFSIVAGGYPLILFKVGFEKAKQLGAMDSSDPAVAQLQQLLGVATKIKGCDALIVYNENQKSGGITVQASDNILVACKSNRNCTKQELLDLLNAVDYASLAKAL